MKGTSKIGFWSSTALVVGNMIGSGIFVIPASLAIYGSLSLLGWLFSSLGAVLLAIVFGNLSKLVPAANGGPYAYTKVSFGAFPAFLVAWSYWISVWTANAAITVALVGYLGVFFPVLDSNPVLAVVTGLAFIWFFTWVNTQSIKTVGFVQLATTLLKMIPIICVGFFGLFYISEATYFPEFNPSGTSDFSALTAVVTLTFFAFLGLESATIPSDSVEDAQKTIKKATFIGTFIAILLYVVSSYVIMRMIPTETLMHSNAPFADAAALLWGDSARYLVAIGAIVSTMGALNGWLLIQGQMPMAAAQDQLFPKIFKKTNSKGAPAIGIFLSSLLVSVLMILNYSKGMVAAFTFMIMLSTLATILPYLLSTGSFALLVRKENKKNKILKYTIALLAFCFSIWIVIGCGLEVTLWGAALLLAGVPFYFLVQKK